MRINVKKFDLEWGKVVLDMKIEEFITIEEFEKLIKIDLQTGEINNDFYREEDVNKIYWFAKALYRHNIVEEDKMKNIIRKIFMEDIEN